MSTTKPFFVLVKSIKFGGIPTEKRSTPTPTLLAAQKCPNSCTKTITPINTINAKIYIMLS